MLFTVQAVPRYQVPDVELRRGADVTVNPQPQSPRQVLQLITKEKNYNRVTLLSALRWVIYHLNDAANGPPMLVEISFGRVPRGLRKMRWIRRTAFGNPNIDSGTPIRRLPETFESLNDWLFRTAVHNNIERAQNPLPPPPLQPEVAPDDRRVSSSDPNACRICFSHAEKIWIKPCNHRTCKSCILTIRKEAVEAQGDMNASYKCPFCKRFVEEWKEDGPYPNSNPNVS
nr:PREDICTED: uncharacterized protein LOC109044668 [Bemisia tabaci]